jgi:hypothetical protein
MSQFGVDGQSVHLETECHSSKLSHQTVCWVDASFGSKCHVVGLSVDGSSRHPCFIRQGLHIYQHDNRGVLARARASLAQQNRRASSLDDTFYVAPSHLLWGNSRSIYVLYSSSVPGNCYITGVTGTCSRRDVLWGGLPPRNFITIFIRIFSASCPSAENLANSQLHNTGGQLTVRWLTVGGNIY